MSALDEKSVTLPASTQPSGRRRTITVFKAVMVGGLTFGTGFAGVAVFRFNALAWRGSQLLGAAILLAVAAGGVWYWRKAQIWLDVLKDLHT